MKKNIFPLLIISFVCINLMALVYWYSQPDENTQNGFTRVFKSNIKFERSITLTGSTFYFAGWKGTTCYLSSIKNPTTLLEVTDRTVKHIRLLLPDNITLHRGQIFIDSIYFYLADLTSLQLYQGETTTWQMKEVDHGRQVYTECLPINYHSIVFRVFNSSRSAFLISKMESPGNVIRNPSLLQKQIDGLFCVDGMLRCDRTTNKIIYAYFYRNQFICMDSSIQLLYRANTIDTTRYARIKVGNDHTSLSSPPFVVNRRITCDNGKLYVNSNLKADNENQKSFTASDIIDVYDLRDGHYLHSFPIPKVNNQRLRHFAVRHGQVFVLRENELAIFQLIP